MSAISDFITTVCGNYTPVVDAFGNIGAGFAGVDWVFVSSAALLVISVYSIFRIIGAFIGRI